MCVTHISKGAIMRSKELIPILSENIGVPFGQAWVIDRSLANSGLRAKHKGPNPPDMTREEALNFLIGSMCALTATKAGEEVSKWRRAIGMILTYPRPEIPEAEADFDMCVPDPSFQLPHLVATSGQTVTLVDYLLTAMHFTDFDLRSVDITLRISLKSGVATVNFEWMTIDNTGHHRDFFALPESKEWAAAMAMDLEAVAYHEAFEAIAYRTQDPFSGATD